MASAWPRLSARVKRRACLSARLTRPDRPLLPACALVSPLCPLASRLVLDSPPDDRARRLRRKDAPSMFKKKKSLLRLRTGSSESSNPSSTLPTRRVSSGPTASSPPPQDTAFPVRIDDFGRPITTERPAFAAQTTGSSAFGNGYGVGEDEAPPAEMQLLYGFAPIATTIELGIIKVERIVQACAEQIRKRGAFPCSPRSSFVGWRSVLIEPLTGLDTPLILSSMALDLSLDDVCSLIRSYLEDHESWLQGS